MHAWALLLADLILCVHASFALFVLIGGALAWRWPILILAHLPALAWGLTIELSGWICPLTPLENHLRQAAGERPYGGDFIQHYVGGALYPPALSRTLQLWLAALLLIVNATAYTLLARRRGPSQTTRGAKPA